MRLIIATRGSKLALWQSNHIKSLLEDMGYEVELQIFKTKGDKILDTPLALIGGKGLFTKELEDAMLRGDAHLAVHSLKDVPTQLPQGLILGAVTKREIVNDAFLSEKYESIEDLPPNAVIGTTSLRRRMQLLHYRPDLQIKDLRGNVDTRIKKLKNGEFDAIILAYAGLKRLGFLESVRFVKQIDENLMIPAMGQAALGIECVPEVLEVVKTLNDKKSQIETEIEREFVDTLQGGCQVPIGVRAQLLDNGDIITKAVIGMPDGSELLKDKIIGNVENYSDLGKELAQSMIENGAQEILKRAEEIAFAEHKR
ncbi:hydroxymethylbilane synthase [Nitratiruptor sp. YY08-26]|uniref:hydroxymethylbilane synthase n=1 Tax=unclassified Nitratiruptor TaxID=2624044 RepID=UPI001915B270|nr:MULTISPECIES: hydroxymethylbilane synthase [unclassified Nitratiruptor]BCD62392.1 hydroxymethylbilane synthase [Nitratiruptor sp. YY08-13]BCD66328.1 hydroxymethylbilane synthase [Nitratiruptor sp. YY08-26]